MPVPAAGSALEGPRLQLDELLAQLVDRAQDVMSTQNRLQGLLRANQSIIGNLALEGVLERIVEAACELLQAEYGALGVLTPDGLALEQFIHVGIDAETVTRIGSLPQGKGVLGALIADPRPIRLHDLGDDERSVGFPPGHPPMGSFLGVPIRIRNEVFGNLYLTGRHHGDFTAEDEELALALAATAAVAIENARLFEASRRRQEWLQASTNLTRQILTSTGDDALRALADSVLHLAAADVVTVVLPTKDHARLRVAVAAGPHATVLQDTSYEVSHTITELVLETGQPVLVTGEEDASERTLHLSEVLAIGPAMVLPLAGRTGMRGALVVGRRRSGHRFTDADLEMATTFANHASVAVELAEARRDQQRMLLFEERDRIARDLHDHVIQQLFAAGMTLQGVSVGLGERQHAERIEKVIDTLDEAIQQIRTSIFHLRGPLVTNAVGLRDALREIVDEMSEGLGVEPSVRFTGPVETVTDASLLDDVLAVTRECLSNIARHARATSVDVDMTATADSVEVRVCDNGVGMGNTHRRSGLANLRARAERRGGSFTVTDNPEGDGTLVTWRVPVSLADA